MLILNITPHMGGGVGEVVSDLVINDKKNKHFVVALDCMNEQMGDKLSKHRIHYWEKMITQLTQLKTMIMQSDIILVHWWDNPMLKELISMELPPCKMIFWCHKNYNIPEEIKKYPDEIIGTSPVQKLPEYIWSTRDIQPFIDIKRDDNERFVAVGYLGTIDYKKMHNNIFTMSKKIKQELGNNIIFYFAGDLNKDIKMDNDFIYLGKLNEEEVKQFYSVVDIFGYPLRPDHYGTCEQVLGEAMAAGCVPVCMNNPAERTIIQEGQTGFLSKDENEYIDNIIHLYHKKNLLNFMSNNAKQSAATMYDIQTIIKQWDKKFDNIPYTKNKKKAIGGI